ncbi:MAG: hypothetical protein EBU46_08675, partial [Nitrosomonadaceae bacterium]|nr:hypothetical protein [Nitrosomonadaceae bacterium]
NRIGTFLIQGREVAPQEGTIMERSGNGTTFDCEVKSSSGIIWKFEMIWNKDSQMWTLQGLNYSVQLRKMTDDEWKQFNATKYKSIE